MATSNNSLVLRASELPVRTNVAPREITMAGSRAVRRAFFPTSDINTNTSDPVEKSIWVFFKQEWNSGWQPTSERGQLAMRSLADCLVSVSAARYASLPVVCVNSELFTGNRYACRSEQLDWKVSHLFSRVTIRAELETCRLLCLKALGALHTDMKYLRDRAGELWRLDGKVFYEWSHNA
jgi:hypothetical protein